MANHRLRLLKLLCVGACLCMFATACGGGPGPYTTLPRGILNFPQSAIDAQHPGSYSISPTICGGGAFPSDTNTPYEWYPIVPGRTFNAKGEWRPTLNEPQFIAGGQLIKWEPATSADDPRGVRGDIMFAHPFGGDYSWDMALNPASFLSLNYVPPGTGNNLPLHVEIENGLFPYQDFGWGQPQYGDSVLVKGDWIMDCGHPGSYHTELHPPSFLAFARATDPNTTIALAFANPYRTTQLYNPNEKDANAFTNVGRFSDPNTKPFPAHEKDEVTKVIELSSNNLEAHVLIEPSYFDVVTWEVCAPSRKPDGATLDYTYNFTVRTGVAIQPVLDPARGCVKFIATEGGSYVPLSVTPNHVTWSWADIQKAASEQGSNVDVKKMIYDEICHDAHLCGPGIYYQGIENDPIIDRYPDQHPLVGAGADSPIMISSADTQPFPFYGRARVSWKVGAPPASYLAASPAQLAWDNGAHQPKTVTITNENVSGSAATRLGTVTIAGDFAADYTLTADSCSGASLPANASCQITLTFTPKGTGSRDAAVIVTDNGGVRRLTIPLTGPGLIGFRQGSNEVDSS